MEKHNGQIVSLSTMQAFNCQPLGLNLLAADFNEPCPVQTHFMRIWSYIFIAVYPVGIPLFCYLSMMKMGVHLVAQDIKFTLLLKSLVLMYANLSLISSSEGINTKEKEIIKILEDCAEDIKLTKSQAVDILVKFEALEMESMCQEASSQKRNLKQETIESKQKGVYRSCFPATVSQKSNLDFYDASYRIRKRIQKKSDENPRILYGLLLNLAKQLVKRNSVAIPSISWKEYTDASKIKLQPGQVKEPDLSFKNPNYSASADVDLKATYAIHPDLEDDQEWGGWIKFQSSLGNLLMTRPESWNTYNKRKELGRKAIDRIGFVFAAYKVDFWFWEMLEMLRK